MIWWKEWRETRFGFLITLFFVTGLYSSMPKGRMLGEDYWIGVFLVFYSMAIAIVMGAGAVAPELASGTIVFLLSKPAGRAKFLTAKYLVRGGEVMLLIAVPFMCMILPDWEGHSDWFWAPPYLAPQYIAASMLLVAFTYSGVFFFSILFRRQASCALAGITLLGAFLAVRGIHAFRAVHNLEVIKTDIYIMVLLTAATFVASFFAFRMREF